MPVVLYECGTWPLTLTQVRRLKVLEKRVLGRIFWSKRDELAEEWRKPHNEELNDLYCSPNIVRGDNIEKNERGGACNMYGGEERRILGFGGEA